MTGKIKPLMFCPWCEEGQARTWQGMTAHVRAKHPDKITELKDNKEMYLEKFACDEFGNPIGGALHDPIGGSPDPEPEPNTPEPEPTSAPQSKPTPNPPAPEVKPPKPTPESKPEPAEGGGFRGSIRKTIFGN